VARVHDQVLGNHGHQVLFHKNMCPSCPSTRRKVARAFRTTILQKWGTSVRKLITDRERRFNSRLWEWWEQRLGITGRRNTSYRPQADGTTFTPLFLEHGREPTRALDILGQEDKTYDELEDAGYREGAEKSHKLLSVTYRRTTEALEKQRNEIVRQHHNQGAIQADVCSGRFSLWKG